MKILVAGGAGYIGSALVPRLLELGHDVDVIDLLWFGNHLPKDVPLFQKDVLRLTVQDLKPYEQVIFLAGLSNDPMAEYSPDLNTLHNAVAPAHLADLAKRAGVRRFIYAGSCSVYGSTPDRISDESDPAASRTAYGISKLRGEQAALSLAEEGFSVISLRQGTVCGYSPRMRLDLVLNTMFVTAMTTGEITVRHPEIWRPVLAIPDAVHAYQCAVEADPGLSGIFNIASENYTLCELGEAARDTIGTLLRRDLRLTLQEQGDLRNYRVNLEKARTLLRFRPTHDAESILRDLIRHRGQFTDFENPNYCNIRVFQSLNPPPGTVDSREAEFETSPSTGER